MNAKDLSTAVNEVVKLAQTRIEGVGQQQYEESKDRQKFESMSIPDLLEYMEEELLDQINYAVMNFMRIHNVKLEIQKLLTGLENLGLGKSGVIGDIKTGENYQRQIGCNQVKQVSWLRQQAEEVKEEQRQEKEDIVNKPVPLA